MSRNALVVGAIVLVGAVLWVAIAWPAPGVDSALEPLDPETEAPVAEPVPAAAPPPVAAPTEPPPAAPVEAPPPQPVAQAIEQAPPGDPAQDMFAVEQGPVAELKGRFESEPRDSAASDVEARIRAAFAHPGDGAPDMFKSVLCRQTVCKLELNYSEAIMGAYVAAMTRATATMDTNIAVAPAGPRRPDSVRPIEVFIKRDAPPPQPAPEHQPQQPEQQAPAEPQPPQPEQQAPAEPAPPAEPPPPAAPSN